MQESICLNAGLYIAFLMDRRGNWSLAPAYDMTFSYNPNSYWTSSHQMKISAKKIKSIIGQVIAVVREWPQYAEYVGMSEKEMLAIKVHHKYSGECLEYKAELTSLKEDKSKNINA